MDLTKNQILNSFEVETIFNKLLDNEISIEGMHDTIKAQIIAFANKKKEAFIHGLFDSLTAGAINEKMIGGDLDQYIKKHTIREQKIIDFLSIDNSLKESFSSQKIEGFVKNELSTLNKQESKTKDIIINTLNGIDIKGWQYAFRNEHDFRLFTDLLTNFFEYNSYTLPIETIMLKKGCKTKLAKALGEIHNELSNENKLIHDNNYFELIKILNHFKKEPKEDLYKALTR